MRFLKNNYEWNIRLNRLSSNDFQNMNDENLMLAYKDGSTAAFDELYARHKGGLYRYFLRQCGNHPEIASELFQDVWMKLIKARDSYQVSAKFSTWLYRLAHNHLVDYWRKTKPLQQEVEYEENIESKGSQPDDLMQNTQTRKKIKQAISELPEEQRSAILLKEEGALSLLEIAEVTGVNRETVKSRLRYAIKRLRGVLYPLRSVS